MPPNPNYIDFSIDPTSYNQTSVQKKLNNLDLSFRFQKTDQGKFTQLELICIDSSLNIIWSCQIEIEIISCEETPTNSGKSDQPEKKLETFIAVLDCYEKTAKIGHFSSAINVKASLINYDGFETPKIADFKEPGFSDVTFLIEKKKKIYAHKSILAVNSSYFSTMFLSNFAEKAMGTVPLEEVKLDEFLMLLNAIYPTNFEITDENVEKLLEVADMYTVETVLENCGKFLEATNKIELAKKLRFAERYGLSELEGKLFEKTTTGTSIMNSVCQSQNKKLLNSFSETMQTKILEQYAKSKMQNFIPLDWKSVEKQQMKTENIESKMVDWNDTVLKIEGVEVLVNRIYLSLYSTFFQELFYEATEEEYFELEDVKCDNFLSFLSYVYDQNKPITEENDRIITELSVKFKTLILLNRCENYWIDVVRKMDGQPANHTQLKLVFDVAEDSNLSQLQETLLKKLQSDRNKMHSFMCCEEFNQLGPKSRLAVLRLYALTNGYY